MQLPVEFGPAPAGPGRRNLFLAEVRKELTPFRVFGDGVSSVTAPLRFAGGLVTRQRDGALLEDVRALYNDRSAALVVARCGQGTLTVLNCDLTAGNLAASPAFVPLIGELMSQAAARRAADALGCGEPAAVYLPPHAGPLAGLAISGPSDAVGRLSDEESGLLWRWPAAGPPGVYQVQRSNATLYAVATAIPSRESDLRAIEPNLIQERMAGGRAVHYRVASADDEERDSLWSWLAVALIGCLLGEVLALKVFRT
jgi:hypothetical protein